MHNQTADINQTIIEESKEDFQQNIEYEELTMMFWMFRYEKTLSENFHLLFRNNLCITKSIARVINHDG